MVVFTVYLFDVILVLGCLGANAVVCNIGTVSLLSPAPAPGLGVIWFTKESIAARSTAGALVCEVILTFPFPTEVVQIEESSSGWEPKEV
jgi:hypothetical protein